MRAKRGDYAEADVLYQRALHIEQNVDGPDSKQRAITLTEYAKVLRHNGQKRRATEMEKEARAVLDRYRNAIAPTTIDIGSRT